VRLADGPISAWRATDAKPILTYAAGGFSYEFEVPLANLVTTDVRQH
jgi:hypothetical protein